MAQSDILPEDVLLATLHSVGSDVRIAQDQRLADLLNKASAAFGELYRPFAAHRFYRYSKLLNDSLQRMDLGGAIVRENAPTRYFRASKATAGAYGASVFAQLSPDQQEVVKKVAGWIRDQFRASDGVGNANRDSGGVTAAT